MSWLVTAFEPFAGAPTNSSQILLHALPEIPGVRILPHVPTRFTKAWPVVRAALTPDTRGVLALGQAESRRRLSLERVALNWVDTRMPDNSGFAPAQGRIEKGPDMIWSTIPWEELGDSPLWERSYSAGTFVCNTLMYQLLNARAARFGGFVHVPLLETQREHFPEATPRMPLAEAVEGMRQILDFLVRLS